VRYDERVAGDLGKLLAPPYDVSTPDLIAELLHRSPLNMIHLEHVRPDPGDDPHALAAERFRQWRAEGVLRADDRPALYRYDHTFTVDGRRLTRRGVFAAVQLAPWEERAVLPHERTFPGPVAERLERLRTVGANLSPIYLLADEPSGRFRELLSGEEGELLSETTDPDGEAHRLLRLTDPNEIAELTSVIAASQLFVADGHHRYEAALALHAASDRPAGSGFVLALIADSADPNVVILPTHRVVHGLPWFTPDAVLERLRSCFRVEPMNGPDGDRTGGFIAAVRMRGDGKWWSIRAQVSEPHLAKMPAGFGDAWKRLPASILETVVFRELLGLEGGTFAPEVRFTHEHDDAIAAVETGEAQIAFLLPAPSVADLIAVARDGDRMPPKSTYFSPKAPAGLVVHELAGT
jgi:uncharacterized protein (DUF1015 family)